MATARGIAANRCDPYSRISRYVPIPSRARNWIATNAAPAARSSNIETTT
jgi:hypothetical protein